MTDTEGFFSALERLREYIEREFKDLRKDLASGSVTFALLDKRITDLENETPPPLPVVRDLPAAAPAPERAPRPGWIERHVLPRLTEKLINLALAAIIAWAAAHGVH